jgi:VRR-NUC domain
MRWTEMEYQQWLARDHVRVQQGPRAPDLPEAVLLARVITEAKNRGFLCYHTRDSRGSAPGFPDLICCDGHRILAIETKSRIGKLTPEQSTWLNLLQHTGLVEVYVFRPQDWPALIDILARRHTEGGHDSALCSNPVPAVGS